MCFYVSVRFRTGRSADPVIKWLPHLINNMPLLNGTSEKEIVHIGRPNNIDKGYSINKGGGSGVFENIFVWGLENPNFL